MKLSVSEKAPSLNRLSRARKIEKTSPSTQFSVRAILSRVYVQLDAQLDGYREVVCSWKSSELESAEQREGNQNLALSPIQYSRDSQSYLFD